MIEKKWMKYFDSGKHDPVYRQKQRQNFSLPFCLSLFNRLLTDGGAVLNLKVINFVCCLHGVDKLLEKMRIAVKGYTLRCAVMC